MNILEKLFSKTELNVELEPTIATNSLYSYKNDKFVSKRVYVMKITFKVFSYGNVRISVLTLNKNVNDFEIPATNGNYTNIIETRVAPKKKDSNLKTFNQLLRACAKIYIKDYKFKGTKECLLNYLTINETDDGYELDIEKEALDKFYNF